jgi:hypothetical protein
MSHAVRSGKSPRSSGGFATPYHSLRGGPVLLFVPRKPLEETGASYILMNACTRRSCKILLSKNAALCFFTSAVALQNRTSSWIFAVAMLLYQGARAAIDITGLPMTSVGEFARIAWDSSQFLVATTR